MNLKSSNKTDVNMTELVVEIDAESFEKAVEAAYQRQKKNISMPGFRKGKAPRAFVEKYFGKDKSPREMKDQIIALLDDWKAKQPPELTKPQKKTEKAL